MKTYLLRTVYFNAPNEGAPGDNASDPLLRDKEAARLLGSSTSTFWRWVANGTIPKPVKLGGMSRWPRSEIIDVIERCKAARNATAAA
ncbi:MAG: helix-turn-helix domain-containing protein [Rhodopseudomonas sp.]|nr:helix-turn-helix domain-containing protein [Rhodopseudomonas sp.]